MDEVHPTHATPDQAVTWSTVNPTRTCQVIAIDRVYDTDSVATYNTAMGWCIRGRWLGQDAVTMWHDLPQRPARKRKEAAP